MNISSLMATSQSGTTVAVQNACDTMAGLVDKIGKIMAERRETSAARHRAHVSDHLLRDMGLTRQGIREATLADRNELSCSNRSGRAA